MAIAIGDVHGLFHDLYAKIERYGSAISNTDLFILGDANVGFNPTYEKYNLWPALNAYLRQYNTMLYVIRGNHDNPSWFDGKHDFKHIKFLPDYSILHTTDADGNAMLALILGGGISINRTAPRMIENKAWFRDEQFVLDKTFLANVRNVDMVLSHTCPDFCHPTGLSNSIFSWAKNDPTLVDELIIERKSMTAAYNILSENNKIKQWYYGHFHMSVKAIHHQTNFIGLNELEFCTI